MRRILLGVLFLVALVWAIAHAPSLATQGEYDSIVLDFREDQTTGLEEVLADFQQQYGSARFNSAFSKADNVYIVKGDRQVLDRLRQSDLTQYTEFIEPNYRYSISRAPNDPLYSKQWNFQAINVEKAWNETQGEGTIVAVIDTGVTPVKDLENTHFVAGYDFVNDQVEALDDNGHGTHVAGTIAQSTDNHYGVAGIAYKASIMPLKVLGNSGGGEIADIAEAIRFAADHDADVINMSLGGGGESKLLQEAVDYAYNKGVVIIAAAGNANHNSAFYPARLPRVMGVSALGPAGSKAAYSNYGAGVDIAAPGGELQQDNDTGGILQETVNGATGEAVLAPLQGTSMASPHVAGVAALVKAAGVEAPDTVMDILKRAARAPNEDPLNHFGAGQLDAGAAVDLALDGQLNFKDFLRWIRDNGYLNPRFWIDGGAVALLPKLFMVIGAYLFAWFLRRFLGAWTGLLSFGLVIGSSGFFVLPYLRIFDLPHWPLRLMGSAIPEWGNAIQGSSALNPVFASVLIPFLLLTLLLGHPSWRQFAIGSTIGVAACLAVSAVLDPQMLWLGSGLAARLFLGINALLCLSLASLAAKPSGAV